MRIGLDQFVRDHNLDVSVSPAVFSSAVNVAKSHGVTLIMSINGEEFLTTLKGKLSPALNIFAYQCGSAEVALVVLGMFGAAVPARVERMCYESLRKEYYA